MHFNFSLWNHNAIGRTSCFDIVDALASQLQDLGHQVTFSPSCFPLGKDEKAPDDDSLYAAPAVNIFIECFTAENIHRLERLALDDIQFIVIQTEAPGRHGFNDTHGQKEAHMIERQRFFPRAARQALAVGCLIKTAVPWVMKWTPNSHYLELGYSPSRERRMRASGLPVYDYVFSGGLGGRRRKLIKMLESRGLRIGTPASMYGDVTLRNALIGSAHGVLGLRANDKWNIPSSSRFSVALHVGRYVAPEKHLIDTPWLNVLDWPALQTEEAFVAHALNLAQQPQIAYQRQITRFRELMAPEQTMQPFLERIFGVHAIIKPNRTVA